MFLFLAVGALLPLTEKDYVTGYMNTPGRCAIVYYAHPTGTKVHCR